MSCWCHPTISSSVVPFYTCLQSFPSSGSFLMTQLFTSGGQSIGASVSTSLPINIQGWFHLGLTGWISFQSKGFSFFFSSFIFISWRLITLQYCSGFCHTLTWISHGFTCTPHPDPPSHLPLRPIPLGLPSAPGLSTCLMHPTGLMICFTLDNIHVSMLFSWNIPPSPSPTESKSLFYISVSLFLFYI